MLEHCGCKPSKCNKTPKGKMCPKHGMKDCTLEEGLRDWYGKSKSKDGKGGWVNVVTGGTCASDEPGEGTPKCVSSAKRASMTKAERLSAARRKKAADPGQQAKTGAAKPTYVPTDKPKKMKEELDLQEVKDRPGKGSGTKDACYHKVKSRYSVWPSAYASGALVKCRKAGAKNWGNKSEDFIPENHKEVASGKKKDEEGYMSNVEFDQIERSINILRKLVKNPNQQLPAWVQSKITRAADFIDTAADYMSSDEDVSEACWSTHKQVGMKKKGNRMVPDCVKENIDKIQQYGRTYTIILTWHGSTYKLQIFFSTPTIPSRKEVEDAIHKVYPGALLNAYMPSRIDPTKPTLLAAEEFDLPTKEDFAEQALAIVLDPDKEKRRKNYLLNIGVIGEDWQSVNRKDKTDGLSQKAVNAYRRENPGSKLQTAVTEKNPKGKRASRRKSFCSRMSGMKSKLTSTKTARDPDSRINKALRRWNCN